ncbi:MAG: class I SAM-dependent methyltransferase [Candidatus Odinarchaeota archaeon]
MIDSDQKLEELEQELEQLREEGFLLPEEGIRIFNGNIYNSDFWAEVFWRRRERHSTREDPEIQHVFKKRPRNVLEIGSAYGRVLRKLAEMNEKTGSNASITGIELCSYFDSFFQQYSREHPVLNKTRMVYGDFFSSRELASNTYDVILLPMNTLPNFPFSMHPRLFKRVHVLLVDDGYWIFSSHKVSSAIYSTKAEYQGSILLEKKQGPIINEFYGFASQKTDYGARIVSYSRYTKLTRDHEKEQSFLFRSVVEFILPEIIDKLAREHHFKVAYRDDSSHSTVHVLQKE